MGGSGYTPCQVAAERYILWSLEKAGGFASQTAVEQPDCQMTAFDIGCAFAHECDQFAPLAEHRP